MCSEEDQLLSESFPLAVLLPGGPWVRWCWLPLPQVVSALNYLKEKLNVLHRGEELLALCVRVCEHVCVSVVWLQS